jgi:type 1 glutamine amidotransferase/HEAT repeat protein
MRLRTSIVAATLTLGLFTGLADANAKDGKIDVLLVDGQNNHNWRATSPVLLTILADAGLFDVDVATTTKDLSKFRPNFAKYDVVVSNYNGADWPEETRKAFVDFIRGGGGLVSVHAADNSFPRWKEYNEMIGVGGWGGRNEKDGPMIYWEDGEFVHDTRKGSGGSHGSRHAFQLVTRDPEHPITKGLPEKWTHAADELYSNLRGPAKGMRVLATAFADKKTGGTGRHEPILMTIDYGKGRVFHTTMGHDVGAMNCAGFAFTLQRGTEWAATGKVTLNDVPATFPTADAVKLWLPAAVFATIRSYDFGDSRTDLAAIEEACRGASPAFLAKIESKLLVALAAAETKYAGKQFVLRMLRRIGSGKCVPALEKLLVDKELAHNARWALERLPAAEASAALRRALPGAKGELKIGVVGSLGIRKDTRSIGAISNLLGGESKLSLAAIKALGRIGGMQAVQALIHAPVHADQERARDNAIITCAESLAASGRQTVAVRIFHSIAGDGKKDALVRLAAFRGSLLTEGEKAVPTVIDLLAGSDETLAQGARTLLRESPDAGVSKAIVNELSKHSPEVQVLLIEALVRRGDRGVGKDVLSLVKNSSATVAQAAIAALGTLGGGDSVGTLTTISLGDGKEGELAFASLSRLRGDDVVEAIFQIVDHEDPRYRRRAIEVLTARHETRATVVLIRAATDEDAGVRAAAFDALGTVGDAEAFALVLVLVGENKRETEHEALSSAIRSIAERLDERVRAAASRLTTDFLDSDNERLQLALLGVAPVLSTNEGLAGVRKLLPNAKRSLSRAAVEALAAWRDPAPLADLLQLTKTSPDKEIRSIALEGYTRLLSLPANRPAMETVKFLDEAIDIASSDDEKRRIVTKLGDFPCKEGLALAEKHAKNETLAAAAKGAASKIRGVLIQNSLVATSSHNSGDTRRAFDKDPRSRWSTNTPMKPGMWFMIDLGAEQSVTKIILDSRDSPGDYPRGCEVYLSFNGKDWGKPVLTSPPQKPITRLNLKKPTRARFVKIVQTGETQGLYWSIHNLRIDFE